MGKIIAVGGGEIGRPGTDRETLPIDKEIVKLSGKAHPHLLFIGTASDDSQGYFNVIEKYFGKRLGCRVEALRLLKEHLSRKKLERKIFGADIIYVGGGNTLKMLLRWRRLGVDSLLRQAYKKGIVLSGVSAGSICWFRGGNSDSRKFRNPKADYIKISALGIIPALHSPHYDKEPQRAPSLKRMMKKTPGVAIALENCTALEVIDNQYRLLASKKNVHGYKIYWKQGAYHKEKIAPSKNMRPLQELVSK